MPARTKTATCEHCDKHFSPCRFNKHNQKYCSRECRATSDRKRKREYYRKRYRNKPDFQEAERIRCKANIDQRRQDAREAKRPPPPSPPPSPLISIDLQLATVGFLATQLESIDQQHVLEVARSYERRGRALAMPAVPSTSNTGKTADASFPRHSLSLEKAVPRHSLSPAPP